MSLETVAGREQAEPLYDAMIQEHSGVSGEPKHRYLAVAYYNQDYIKEIGLNVGVVVENYSNAIWLGDSFDVTYYRHGRVRYRLGW